MTTETKHTPLTMVGAQDRYLIRDDCKTASYAMVMLRTTPEECKKRAQHIVRCVNSHDDLLAALQRAEAALVRARGVFSDTQLACPLTDEIEQARAAIERATKG